MGQKVNPIGFRVGVTEEWRSRWYAGKKEFGKLLVEDKRLRQFVKKNCFYAGIPKIEIERNRDVVVVTLHVARPGMIIGRKGAEVERLREELVAIAGRKVEINIKEVLKPELEAQLVGEAIAEQLVKRASFRRVMKRAMEGTMKMGALGVKIQCSGRLGGAEIARQETYHVGKVPLHTLRAVISYGFAEASTTYGNIGIKVWIYLGLKGDEKVAEEGAAPRETARKETGHAAHAETGQVS
ncbi:MAG: 30S ribosomal protein S3 [Planctomycetota bacterium]